MNKINDEIKWTFATETDQLEFGAHLASVCVAGTFIGLQGELGAGKTTLVRGFLQHLGYTGRVKSPTFTLLERYDIESLKIFHFDLYRLNDPLELEAIGIRDYFDGQAIVLIEWIDKAIQQLPVPDIICTLHILKSGRDIRCKAMTDKGKEVLTKLNQRVTGYKND